MKLKEADLCCRFLLRLTSFPCFDIKMLSVKFKLTNVTGTVYESNFYCIGQNIANYFIHMGKSSGTIFFMSTLTCYALSVITYSKLHQVYVAAIYR